MELFKVSDLGGRKVVMAFDGSGWRVTEKVEVRTSGPCPACGVDTSASPGAHYAIPRPENKGKEPVVLCSHEPGEVEQAKKCLSV
jgi:hypothetical protein